MTTISAESVMRRMGIPPEAPGKHVLELHRTLSRMIAAGMTNHSGGSWAPEAATPSPDARARAYLLMQRAIERGHGYRVECLDPPISFKVDVRTMRRSLVIHWRSAPAWFGDRWRSLRASVRMWWDRNSINPYL